MNERGYVLTGRQVDELNVALERLGEIDRLTIGEEANVDAGRRAIGGVAHLAGGKDLQLVELSSTTPNGDGTYSGWWIQTVNGTPERQSEIRIVALGSASLTTSQYYFAFFSHHDDTNHVGVFAVPNSAITGGGNDAGNVVSVTGGATTSGSGWAVYPGALSTFSAGSFFDSYSIWVVDVNGGSLSTQRYLGRVVGYDYSDSKYVYGVQS